MAVKAIRDIVRYEGLSGDAKPTGQPVGSTFHETDTGIDSIYNGSTWVTIAASTNLTQLNGTALSASNPVPVSQTAASSTDGSTTIAAGGTAQNLFGGTTPANGFEVVNPDASEDLWISDTTTAVANGAGCIRVAANGGSYTTPVGYKPPGAVSIVGATTGHKIRAVRW